MQGPLPTQVFVECQAAGCASVLQVRAARGMHSLASGLPVAVGCQQLHSRNSICVPPGNLVSGCGALNPQAGRWSSAGALREMQQVSAVLHESKSNCCLASSTAATDMQHGIMDLWEASSLQQLDNQLISVDILHICPAC